jgi:hypothetical protein
MNLQNPVILKSPSNLPYPSDLKKKHPDQSVRMTLSTWRKSSPITVTR